MPGYTVQSPLSFDNEHYAVGETVTMDEKTAAPLLDGGVIQRSEGRGQKTETPVETPAKETEGKQEPSAKKKVVKKKTAAKGADKPQTK